jgi:hypothetical protein
LGRAVVQVILHQVPRYAAQRLLHRSHLRDDVGAVAVRFDNSRPVGADSSGWRPPPSSSS